MASRPLVLLALAACTPGDVPRFRGGSPELLAPDPGVPLSRVLRVDLDREAHLELEVSDSRGERTLRFDEEARSHDVPLLGFRPGDEVTVRVTAIGEEGANTAEALRFRAGTLPERFPLIDVLVDRPDLAEPGLLLFPIELVSDEEESVPWVVALDESREVVWVWSPPRELGDLRMHPSGSLYGLSGGVAWQFSPLGEVLGQWGAERVSPAATGDFQQVDVAELTHELFVQPDAQRFVSLYPRQEAVPAYPCSYAEPTTSCGPDLVTDIRMVQFTREGEVIRDWSMLERLDGFHIGFDALNQDEGARDWAHGNAVVPLPDEGWLVSLRHQDALVALDRRGQVRWILGDPAGWSAELTPRLLEPVGEPFRWPYHGHGPTFASDGTLWVFDNGNDGRTPYGVASAEPIRSRVVGYRIDEAAGTVTQVAEYRETATGPLFSTALGNAFGMPTTGNVMGVYGMPTEQDDVGHTRLGFGSRLVRLVEWTPSGELASDVRLRSDVDVEPKGWRSYRATWTPSLYAEGVETWSSGGYSGAWSPGG